MSMCIFHNWSKWKDKNSGNVLRTEDNAYIGMFVYQERRCSKCNKVQLRTVKTTLYDEGW